jgi:type VI secretion system protein ImpL
MLLWALIAVGIVLVWLLSILASFFGIDVPLLWRFALSVGLILVGVGVIVYRRLRATARAKALERELAKQSDLHAANARPDRRADIVELQRQMQQGITALKDTKLGKKHGRAALYVLPWYAIIGPPGAGKTTALRHSGLSFPFTGGGGSGAVKGVGGTRNCDWWFTNDGILLDTAGRFAVQDDDHEEWLAFLDTLRRYRTKKPLNGLIVAVSIADVFQSTSDQLHALAHQLRARVDEIINHLGVVLPVYLMFTKSDLVGGFVEFWGELRKQERDQLLGATFSLDGLGEDAGEKFSREFDLLVGRLHARAVRIVGEERRPDVRAKLLQFPGEFRVLRNGLSEFTRALFEANNYQESPLFRGFYFTSGTQEGRPFDRVMDGMARAFGLRVPQAAPAQTEPKSYFVTDLFKKVVFPDHDLAVRTATEEKRQQWLRWGIIGGAGLLAALIALPALASFLNNQNLLRSATVEAQSLSAAQFGQRKNTDKIRPQLDAVLNRLLVLDYYEKEGVPWPLRWGMYVGDDLEPALQKSYLAGLDKSLVAEVRGSIERDLASYPVKTPQQQSDEYAAHYDKLKLYLMMSEPEREHLDQNWAIEQLTDLWVRERGDNPEHTALQQHTKYYIQLFSDKVAATWPRDEAMVTRVRSKFIQVPSERRLYNQLIQDAEKHVAPIRHEDIFYGTAADFVEPKRNLVVPGSYTKAGWARVKPKLDAARKEWEGEAWVLGPEVQETKEAIKKAVDQVEILYFKRYQDAWRDFIQDIEVHEPVNTVESLDELRALSEPEWPYLRLLRTLGENIALDPPKDTKEATLIEKGKELLEKKIEDKTRLEVDLSAAKEAPPKYKTLQEAFAPLVTFAVPKDPNSSTPTGLNQYMEQVALVVGVLDDLAQNNSPPDASLSTALAQAIQRTTELATTQTAFTRPLLTHLLLPPLRGSFVSGVGDQVRRGSGRWELEVWERWKTDLKPYYPFNPQSPRDASIEAFSDFFKPTTGLLWAFYDSELKGALVRSGDEFNPAKKYGAEAPYTDHFRRKCLTNAAKITDSLFPAGSEAPKLEMSMNLHSVSPNVSLVEFKLDGAEFHYKNTPQQWQPALWPNPEGDEKGAFLRVTGINKLDARKGQERDFGFFRFLEDSQIRQPVPDNDRAIIAAWVVAAEQTRLEMDIRTERVGIEPLIRLFREIDCQRIIAR